MAIGAIAGIVVAIRERGRTSGDGELFAPCHVVRARAAPVVAEFLPVATLGAMAVDLPGLAHLAARTTVSGPAAFVIHAEYLQKIMARHPVWSERVSA